MLESTEPPKPMNQQRDVARVQVTIVNSLGLHARPAAMFVQVTSKYEDCDVRVGRVDEEPVDGKSIMGLMMLAAGKGTTLEIEAAGPQSSEVVNRLAELIRSCFGEE
jgi:phosphocarrier protein